MVLTDSSDIRRCSSRKAEHSSVGVHTFLLFGSVAPAPRPGWPLTAAGTLIAGTSLFNAGAVAVRDIPGVVVIGSTFTFCSIANPIELERVISLGPVTVASVLTVSAMSAFSFETLLLPLRRSCVAGPFKSVARLFPGPVRKIKCKIPLKLKKSNLCYSIYE